MSSSISDDLDLSNSASPSLYHRVRDLVLSGKLGLGERLRETEIAAQLGVSRIPVRESLAKMVGQGLLVRGRDGDGVRTRRYSEDEVRQLYEYRAALETAAAGGMAQHATAAEVDQLRAICKESEQKVDRDTRVWADLEYRFHSTLADGCRNERVAQALKVLIHECYSLFYIVLPDTNPRWKELRAQVLATQHYPLTEAIAEHDVATAQHLAREAMLVGFKGKAARIASARHSWRDGDAS